MVAFPTPNRSATYSDVNYSTAYYITTLLPLITVLQYLYGGIPNAQEISNMFQFRAALKRRLTPPIKRGLQDDCIRMYVRMYACMYVRMYVGIYIFIIFHISSSIICIVYRIPYI
jgi:hypothetical protein